MLRSRRVIALSVLLSLVSAAVAQTELPAPPKHPPRKPTTRPATGDNPSGNRPRPEPRRPTRPVRPDFHQGPEAATASETGPAGEGDEAAASQPTSRRARDLSLPATRPARDPQVIELQISSAEGEDWGRILIELYPERTPITSRTFVQYVKDGFYDGTIFHRVIPGFIVQGGGYTTLTERKTEGLAEAVRNESRRGTLRNGRGMVAMARKQDPHSALSQFFINLADNEQLDYPRAGAYGYCVFGKVIEGMDVADRIAAVETRVSAAAQRRYDRYMEEGRPVEKAEQSEPLNPPVLKRARLLDVSELPESVTSGPAGTRAQPRPEQRPETQPATEPGQEQPTEPPATEPAAESESGEENAPMPEAAPDSETDSEAEQENAAGQDNVGQRPKVPAKRAAGPKRTQ